MCEVEDFSEHTSVVIEQDFYVPRSSPTWRVVKQEAVEAVDQRVEATPHQYSEYRVNRNILVGKLKHRLIKMVMEKGERLSTACAASKKPYTGHGSKFPFIHSRITSIADGNLRFKTPSVSHANYIVPAIRPRSRINATSTARIIVFVFGRRLSC